MTSSNKSIFFNLIQQMLHQLNIIQFIYQLWLLLIILMIESNSAEVQTRVGQLQTDHNLPDDLRDNKIGELRKSLVAQQGQDSSFKVITSIANTMIGSSIIVYPILFVKDGIIGSLIIMLAIGTALFFTCRLLLIHNRNDEQDFGCQIKRILGQKWARLNSTVNILLIFVVSIAYFMLINGNFFDITAAIFHQINGYVAPKTGSFTFDKYSNQYSSLIAIIFTAPLICRRDIQFLMNFFKFTIYLVFAYGIFIAVSFIHVLSNGTLNLDNYVFFDPDFSTVAGAFALSFLLHPVAPPILKRNIKPENNMRDLLLGYGLTALIYVFVGFIGGLTCTGVVTKILDDTVGQYQTVFDCVKKQDDSDTTTIVFFVFGKIVQLGIFIQNLSVMPILNFLTRKQFVSQFSNPKWKQNAFHAYNIAVIICCLLVTFFDIDVSIVISLDGAVVGFFMAYAIPIVCHLTCYHQKLSKGEKLKRSELLLSVDTIDGQTSNEALKCNQHPPRSFMRHLLIYGSLMVVGVAIAILKMMSLFK